MVFWIMVWFLSFLFFFSSNDYGITQFTFDPIKANSFSWISFYWFLIWCHSVSTNVQQKPPTPKKPYFSNMIRLVKRKETWLSDYAISANNFDLALETFYYFVVCFFFAHFWKFLSVCFPLLGYESENKHTERWEYIRFNWFMIFANKHGSAWDANFIDFSSESFSAAFDSPALSLMSGFQLRKMKLMRKVFNGINWLKILL